MTCLVGRAIAPAVTANTAARVGLAVGKKALARMTIDLTFVCMNQRLLPSQFYSMKRTS